MAVAANVFFFFFLRARMEANESARLRAADACDTRAETMLGVGRGIFPSLAALGPPPPGSPAFASNGDLIDPGCWPVGTAAATSFFTSR